MSKVTLTDIVSGYAVVSAYNANNTAIEAALENTLSRDGTAPNAMGANLDMDSHLIRNLSDGTLSADAVNLRQLQATTGTAAAFPSQTGNANKVLKTDGTVVGWESPQNIANSNTPAGNLAATTIQTALDELQSDIDTRALDSAVVHDTGNETVAGVKTFSSNIIAQAVVDISGASAGQIKFPATQNASTDANTLDDYQEGTWTPSTGATSETNTGSYIKIGNIIIFKCTINITTIGAGSTFSISGLPNTVSSTTPVSVYAAVNLATACVSVQGYASVTSINLSGFTSAAIAPNTSNIFGNGTSLTIAGCYITS